MRVLLVCSGGMSSAIVVKAIENEARKTGRALSVKSIGTGEFEEEVRHGWDAVLIAPQVRHRLNFFQKTAEELNIPLAVIVPQGYSPLGAAKIIEQLKTLGC